MTDINEIKSFKNLIEFFYEFLYSKDEVTKDGKYTLNKHLKDSIFKPPISYREGLELSDTLTTVSYGDEVYTPNDKFLPFTTTEEFDSNKWNLIIRNKFFPERNKESLEKLSSYPDGTIASIDNLFYIRKEGYIGEASAGREFGIDHIKPLDDKNISPGHFHKYSESITDNDVGINYAIEYANSDMVCGGTVVLKNDTPYRINKAIKMLDGVTLTGESDVYSNESRLATLVVNSELTPTVLGNKNNVLAGMILDGVKGVNIKGIEIDMEDAPDETIGIIVAGYNYLDIKNINIFNVNNNQKPILFVMKDNLSLLYANIKNLILSAKRDYKGIMCDIEYEKLYGGNATKDKRIQQTTFDNLRTIYGGTSVRLIKPGGSIKFNNLQMRKGDDTNKAFICKDPLSEKPQVYGGRVNGFKYAFPSNKVVIKDYLFKKRTEPFYSEDEEDLLNLENNKPDFSIGNDQSQYNIINYAGTTIHESYVIFENKIIKEDKKDYNQLDNKLILLSTQNFENRSAHYLCNLDIDIPDSETGIRGYFFQIYMRGKETLIRNQIGDAPITDNFGLRYMDISIENITEYDYFNGNYKKLLLTNNSRFDIRITFSVTGSIKTYEADKGKYDSIILPDDQSDRLYPIEDDIIRPTNPPVFF